MATAAQEELARIQAARQLLADRIAGIRADFATLEESLRGNVTRVAPGVAAGASKIRAIRQLGPVLPIVPAPAESTGTAGLLAQYGKYGFRERSFDVVVPVTAPNEINSTGSYYDAGNIYDAWILNPSVDTKISFTAPPSQNTPFISANSRMQFQVRAQKVWYLAQNAGTTGVMQIWLLAFKD